MLQNERKEEKKMSLFVRVLHVLIAIVFVVLAYYVIVWVLGLIGVNVPDHILRIVMVLLGLLAVVGALTGRFDNWWKQP